MSGQLLLGVRLRDSSVFASYHAGPNRAVVEQLRSIAPGVLPPTVFLQGAASTGKSHLLQAVCAEAPSRGLSAAYLPLHDLRSMGPELLSGWGELDVVCVDDVECVAAEPAWNRALFALHQRLEERRARLIVASSHVPAALPMSLRDLGSRLSGALFMSLTPLNESDQIQALSLHAQLRGFELPEETAVFLLRRLPRDMTTLCRFLDELDEASLIAHRRLTVRFVAEILKNRESRRESVRQGDA